jgi:hypothetical protein
MPAARRGAPANSVKRRIHFYRAVVPKVKGQPGMFDPTAALAHISRLPFSTTGRYMDDGERLLCCWVEKAERLGRARLAVVRRDGLPSVEQDGVEKDLQLSATEGLVEQTHIRLFDHNIVGCDFNFYGPRLPSLGRYLLARGGPKAQTVTFEPLVRGDVAKMLDDFAGVRMLTLRVRRSEVAELEKIDKNLGRVMRAQANLGAADVIELTLGVKPYSRGATLGAGVFGRVKKLAKSKEIADLVDRFVVDAVPQEGGRSRELNILDDHLIGEEEISKRGGRGRRLDHASTYAAIGHSFEALKGELVKAASLSAAAQVKADAASTDGEPAGR